MAFKHFIRQELRFVEPFPEKFQPGHAKPVEYRLAHGHWLNFLGNLLLMPWHLLIGKPIRVVHGYAQEAEVEVSFPPQLIWEALPLEQIPEEGITIRSDLFVSEDIKRRFVQDINQMGYHAVIRHSDGQVQVATNSEEADKAVSMIHQAFFQAILEPRDHGAALHLPKVLFENHARQQQLLLAIPKALKVQGVQPLDESDEEVVLVLPAKGSKANRQAWAKGLTSLFQAEQTARVLQAAFPVKCEDSSSTLHNRSWRLKDKKQRCCVPLDNECAFARLVYSLDDNAALAGRTIRVIPKHIAYTKQELAPRAVFSGLAKCGLFILCLPLLPFFLIGGICKALAWSAGAHRFMGGSQSPASDNSTDHSEDGAQTYDLACSAAFTPAREERRMSPERRQAIMNWGTDVECAHSELLPEQSDLSSSTSKLGL